MENIANIIAEILETEGVHIASHVTILRGDLPDGKRLTLKIEAPKRHWLESDDDWKADKKARAKEKELIRASRSSRVK